MKAALFFALLSVCVFVVCSQTILNWGNTYTGRVLYQESVYASSSIFSGQNRTVNYPPRVSSIFFFFFE